MESDFSLWKKILDYSIYSPSPHNTQPWKVKIIDTYNIELYYDPSRLLPVEDPDAAFMTVGLGIFIETLSIASAKYKYELNVSIINEINVLETNLGLFARIKLQDLTRKEELDAELIKKRRTSRLNYSNSVVDEKITNEVKLICKDYANILVTSTRKEDIDWILRINQQTLFYDMEEARTKYEVGSWLRFNENEANKKKDGLSAKCMNIFGVMLFAFFKYRAFYNLPIISFIVEKYYLRTMRGTNNVAWIKGSFNNTQDWLKAGRMLMRMWLTFTKYDIYIHPFGSVITNKKSHLLLKEKFNVEEKDGSLWLLFRFGYSKTPPQSKRLGLNDILIDS